MRGMTVEALSVNEYNDIIKISKARERKVIKHNDIVRKAKIDLNVNEQKMINYIISLIKPPEWYPDNKQPLEYEFEIMDYCKICGVTKCGDNYNMIRECLRSLCKKDAIVDLGHGKETRVTWVNKFWASKGQGLARVRLDDDLAPYIFDLSAKTTRFDLFNILAMNSKYSIRMYEICKSWAGLNSTTYKTEELRELLGVPKSVRYPDFRRNALEVSQKEIEENTDLIIDYEFTTKGRKVVEIKINIKKKAPKEASNAKRNAEDKLDLH